MSTNLRERTVNGNVTKLWGQGQDTAARKLAAALPRADTRLRKVEAACYDRRAIAWFDPPEGAADDLMTVDAPAGWNIAQVDHFADGTIAVVFGADR